MRKTQLKYLHHFYLTCFLCVWCGSAAAVNTTAEADRFLKQLLGAEHDGMGGSFVGATRGANALGSNPAGISVAEGSRFVIHARRFPRTIATISRRAALSDNVYADDRQYEQRAAGIQTLNWAFPIGRAGTLGFGFAFAQEGAFRRVNHEGKALNNFPENNLALGLSYGVHLFGGTGIGFDARWLRSKVADATGKAHFGHGYAYNVGIIQQFGDAIQVGVVARNLSNGLSFSDATIPRAMQRDVVAGIAYRRQISDVAFRIGFDAHPPFRDGIRANLGAEVWYRERIGCRIGYLRDTEKRYTPVLLLNDDTFETEERLWKSEGLCFGLGVRFGSLIMNAAYTPQFTPTAAVDERVYIVQGEAIYTFSVGQVF